MIIIIIANTSIKIKYVWVRTIQNVLCIDCASLIFSIFLSKQYSLSKQKKRQKKKTGKKKKKKYHIIIFLYTKTVQKFTLNWGRRFWELCNNLTELLS